MSQKASPAKGVLLRRHMRHAGPPGAFPDNLLGSRAVNRRRGHLAAPLHSPEVAAHEEEVEDRELDDQAPDRPQVRQGWPQTPSSGSPTSTYLLSIRTDRC